MFIVVRYTQREPQMNPDYTCNDFVLCHVCQQVYLVEVVRLVPIPVETGLVTAPLHHRSHTHIHISAVRAGCTIFGETCELLFH